MASISHSEVSQRIMFEGNHTIKYMGIYSKNPYAKQRYATLGFPTEQYPGVAWAEWMNKRQTPEHWERMDDKVLRVIKTKFPDAIVSKEFLEGSDKIKISETDYVVTAIKIEGLNHVRALVQHLADTHWLKESDVEKLVPHVRQVEQHLEIEKELVASATKQQSSIIEKEFEKDIEAVIAVCSEAFDKGILLKNNKPQREIVLSVIVDSMQLGLDISFFQNLPAVKEKAKESVTRLHNFYHGNAGLENKLRKVYFTCPNLEKQREIFLKYLETKLDQMMCPERPDFLENEILQQVRELRIALFAKGEPLNLIDNGLYRTFLKNLLDSKEKSTR